MTSHYSLVHECASVCVCPRPEHDRRSRSSAETTPANDFEPVRCRRHNSQRPSVLRHLSSIHWTHHITSNLPRKTRVCLCVSGLAKEAYRGFQYGVRATERRMLQLRGCYSASPCPPDMGLVRPIVYLAFRTTPNALVRGGALSSLSEGQDFVCRTRRVWIAGFT